MWNWLASGLASEATLILYDGSPLHPSADALFELAEAERIAVFGTLAKFIDSVKKAGIRPRENHDLASIRLITSTGSPLAPESFDFVYDAIGGDLHLASISGGTDIVSCFALGMIRVWLIWSRSARVSLFAAISSFSVILNLLAMPRGVSPLCTL